jgi:DNA-binding XRE family transcriptional regulator
VTASATSTGVGAHLRTLRRQTGLTAVEVARRMGISKKRVWQIEVDARDHQMSTVVRYCDAIGARIHIGLNEPKETT